MYRIISYEADGAIKVIREESIGSFAWDSSSTVTKAPWRNTNFEEQEQISTRYNNYNEYCNYSGTYCGCNVWGTQNNTYYEGQTLNELYNSFHYKWYSSADATTLNSGASGAVTQEASLNILLNREWLKEVGLEKYIDNHEFDVGGVYEQNTNFATEKKEQATYKWYGKIGLMYITDMVESSTNPNCTSVYGSFYYNNSAVNSSGEWPCKNTITNTDYGNWMNKTNYYELSLTANTKYQALVWYVYKDGSFAGQYANITSLGIRPVFFLKPDTLIIGEGTKENPYRIIS